jgi:hypothetical protein
MGSTDLDSDLEALLLPATPVIVHHAVYPYYNLGAPSLPPPRVLSQRLCIYTTDEQRPRYFTGAAAGGNSSGLLSMPASPHGAAVTGTGLTRGGVTSSNSPSSAAAGTTAAVSYSNSGYTAGSSSSSDAAVAVASPNSAHKRPFSKLSIRKFGSIGGSVPSDTISLSSPSGSSSSSKRRETAGGVTAAESPRRVANAHERPKMEDVAQRRGKSTGGRGGY